MSPSIAILLSGLLQSVLKLLEREFSDDDKKASEEKAEEFASLFNKKDSEVA